MEGGGSGDVVGGGSGTRWNPTKDQITLLEGFYKQGVRTPTAEQIQQITARLKVFGHIEGKNVFYWFQNHKARQRQKQKQQENVAYFNRYFRKAAAPMGCYPPTNFQNLVCSPYYIPQNELGFYQRYPKVLLQGGVSPKRQMPTTTTYHYGETLNEDSKQETLPLFPLEPTGVLQSRSSSASHSLTPLNCNIPTSSEMDDQPSFFDFFAGNNGTSESD